MNTNLTKEQVQRLIQKLAVHMGCMYNERDIEISVKQEYGSNYNDTIRITMLGYDSTEDYDTKSIEAINFVKQMVDDNVNVGVAIQHLSQILNEYQISGENFNQKFNRMINELDGLVFGVGTICHKRSARFNSKCKDVFGEQLSWEFILNMMLIIDPFFSNSQRLFDLWMSFLYE